MPRAPRSRGLSTNAWPVSKSAPPRSGAQPRGNRERRPKRGARAIDHSHLGFHRSVPNPASAAAAARAASRTIQPGGKAAHANVSPPRSRRCREPPCGADCPAPAATPLPSADRRGAAAGRARRRLPFGFEMALRFKANEQWIKGAGLDPRLPTEIVAVCSTAPPRFRHDERGRFARAQDKARFRATYNKSTYVEFMSSNNGSG